LVPTPSGSCTSRVRLTMRCICLASMFNGMKQYACNCWKKMTWQT
jgi:hypothetical protein